MDNNQNIQDEYMFIFPSEHPLSPSLTLPKDYTSHAEQKEYGLASGNYASMQVPLKMTDATPTQEVPTKRKRGLSAEETDKEEPENYKSASPGSSSEEKSAEDFLLEKQVEELQSHVFELKIKKNKMEDDHFSASLENSELKLSRQLLERRLARQDLEIEAHRKEIQRLIQLKAAAATTNYPFKFN